MKTLLLLTTTIITRIKDTPYKKIVIECYHFANHNPVSIEIEKLINDQYQLKINATNNRKIELKCSKQILINRINENAYYITVEYPPLLKIRGSRMHLLQINLLLKQ